MKNNIQSLVFPLGLVAMASLIYSVGTSTIFLLPMNNLPLSYLFTLIIFMPLGFMLIPHMVSKRNEIYSSDCEVKFHWKSYICIALMIFLVNHFVLGSDEYFHQMIIAMCEEFLFRFVIYRVLRKNYSYLLGILIGSLLFGVLLHLNYPLVDNLLVRFPLGLLFSLLATKLGLEYAVGGHWIFNLYQSII